MPQFGGFGANASAEAPVAGGATKLVERDVEAPDVFQVTEAGLWDGRPSLGGVWVAHPETGEPERVIIRNTSNGKFVIGSLFKRELNVAGPKLQVSSDAAAALGLLAGAPVQLNVTALRREAVSEAAPAPAGSMPAPADVDATPLDPIASAAAAIDAAPESGSPAPMGAAADTALASASGADVPAPAVAPAASALSKPFIQIGIFSVEANARRTAERLRTSGIVPQVLQGQSSGKSFWRVIVGPASSSSERATLLQKVKGQGFSDAYFVTN